MVFKIVVEFDKIIILSILIILFGYVGASFIENFGVMIYKSYKNNQNIVPNSLAINDTDYFSSKEDFIIKIKNNGKKYYAYYNFYNTGSMKPVVDNGSLVIIEYDIDHNNTNVKLGDIYGLNCKNHKDEGICKYMYETANGSGVMHQVIGFCDDGGFKTKGINNFIDDGVCWDKEDIEYKVVGVIWTN